MKTALTTSLFPIINTDVSMKDVLTSLQDNFIDTFQMPNTQKARGVIFLEKKQKEFSAINWTINPHLLFDAGEEFTSSSFNYPVFARPCPIVPKHGFVDSKICKDADELNDVSKTTFKVEPEGEILVTKPINATYSAIVCGEIITFGKGNDGATAGKNCNYFYLTDHDYINKTIKLDNTLLLKDEVPFYELVFDNSTTYVVQVRSAPKVSGVKDFIPSQITPTTILKAEGDLIEWEHLMKKVDKNTTVIDHKGGSLSSHYAIHAVINKIPIFTTKTPIVGTTYEPTAFIDKITDEDRQVFFDNFCAGFILINNFLKRRKDKGEDIMTASGNIVKLALSALHNYTAIYLNKDYKLLGTIVGLFVRATFAVSNGESRFCKGKTGCPKEIDPGGRAENYQASYSRNVTEAIKRIEVVYYIFKDIYWGGGYGGPKWATCTINSINLYNACVAKDIEKVGELFNTIIHSFHNGGPYLNKIINPSFFDAFSKETSKNTLQMLPLFIDYLETMWDCYETIPWKKEVENIVKVRTDRSLATVATVEGTTPKAPPPPKAKFNPDIIASNPAPSQPANPYTKAVVAEGQNGTHVIINILDGNVQHTVTAKSNTSTLVQPKPMLKAEKVLTLKTLGINQKWSYNISLPNQNEWNIIIHKIQLDSINSVTLNHSELMNYISLEAKNFISHSIIKKLPIIIESNSPYYLTLHNTNKDGQMIGSKINFVSKKTWLKIIEKIVQD